VTQYLCEEGFLDDGKLRLRPLVLPDVFIEHATKESQVAQAGLSAKNIVAQVLGVLRRQKQKADADEEVRLAEQAREEEAKKNINAKLEAAAAASSSSRPRVRNGPDGILVELEE